MKAYVMDACALIAFLNDEEGADKVEEILLKAEAKTVKVYLHKLNMYEIYYGINKADGAEMAEEAYQYIKNLPIIITDKIEDKLMVEGAKLKSKYKMSLADSIALGEATIRKAAILTADHHEFDVLDKNKELEFLWIR